MARRLALRPPCAADRGQCIARLPRSVTDGIAAGDVVTIRQGCRVFLCVALPRDNAPSISVADEGFSSAVAVRVDTSISYVEPHSISPAVDTARPEEGSHAFILPHSKSHVRKSSTWPHASSISVRIEKDGAGLSETAVLARAKKALRSLGSIPFHAGCGDGTLTLHGDGGNVIASIRVLPPLPVVISICAGATWSISAWKERVQDLKENDDGSSHSSPLPSASPGWSATSPAYTAVCKLLRQDVASFYEMRAMPVEGLLLSGPPGVGKTSGVRKAAEDCGFTVVSARHRDRHGGASIATTHGEPSRALRDAFAEARLIADSGNSGRSGRSGGCGNAIIFIDEIDTLCPKREGANAESDGSGGAESVRTVAQLLSLMDGGSRRRACNVAGFSTGAVYVVAATNRPNAIDPALRRPGRFDREVLLLTPNFTDRAAILLSLCPGLDVDVRRQIAKATPGFVAADLVLLCAEAAKLASRPRSRDFSGALQIVRPSILRGGGLSGGSAVTSTQWSEIGGAYDTKRRLQMAVEWPLQHADTFRALGLSAPRGILLHGPPGCSKTTLVRATATASQANFLHLSGADIYSCYVGEAERILRQAFDAARAAAPSILFLDELDAIVGKRVVEKTEGSIDGNGVKDRVLSTLLTELDGMSHARGVVVVGATNRIDLLDDALLRPGRFDDVILVEPPDARGRAEILRIHAGPCVNPRVDFAGLADMLPGASGAQVAAVAQDAAMMAVRDANESKSSVSMIRVDMQHFVKCGLQMRRLG
jgi:transitional endoplasmic reticulum ATPase